MTYLITYAVYNEPHTVECEWRNGKFWMNDTVAIDEEIILHKELKVISKETSPQTVYMPRPDDSRIATITNNSDKPLNIIIR